MIYQPEFGPLDINEYFGIGKSNSPKLIDKRHYNY